MSGINALTGQSLVVSHGWFMEWAARVSGDDGKVRNRVAKALPRNRRKSGHTE